MTFMRKTTTSIEFKLDSDVIKLCEAKLKKILNESSSYTDTINRIETLLKGFLTGSSLTAEDFKKYNFFQFKNQSLFCIECIYFFNELLCGNNLSDNTSFKANPEIASPAKEILKQAQARRDEIKRLYVSVQKSPWPQRYQIFASTAMMLAGLLHLSHMSLVEQNGEPKFAYIASDEDSWKSYVMIPSMIIGSLSMGLHVVSDCTSRCKQRDNINEAFQALNKLLEIKHHKHFCTDQGEEKSIPKDATQFCYTSLTDNSSRHPFWQPSSELQTSTAGSTSSNEIKIQADEKKMLMG